LERGRIEGGDVVLWGRKVLVGLSEATDPDGVDELRRQLPELGSPREVVPVPFAHRGVIHLDTKFNVVGESVALVARRSFGADTIRWFERHFDLIDATEDEVRGLGVNALAIGGGRVVLDERCERLAGELARRDLQPLPINYAEVTRWPGSFRCTSLPLRRVSEPAVGGVSNAEPCAASDGGGM
jgi:N-dimethylarginine dimethylaminohydrolase